VKVAVVGKGGSGKTTTAAVLARALARQGRRVVALDCDTNANLGLSLGMGVDTTESLLSLRERLDAGEADHASTNDELLERFGRPGPDGLQFAVVTRIENPDPGCPCCGMSPHQLLDQLDSPGRIVIADLEAGIETLTRVAAGALDAVVIVVEPTVRSLDVAERALGLAATRATGQVHVVANRIEGSEDLAAVRARFPDLVLVVVPEDGQVTAADREGVALYDLAPGSPAATALVELAEELAGPVPVG
jgi:CO dehydrogenase maturation factor